MKIHVIDTVFYMLSPSFLIQKEHSLVWWIKLN